MLPFVNLNGVVLPGGEAHVSIFDHGLLYGDGLFETVRVEAGRPCWLDRHLNRLEESAARIHLTLPWSRDVLVEAVQATIAANRAVEAGLRLTVTRGEGPPAPDPSRCGPALFFITLRERPAGGGPARVCFAGEHPHAFVPGLKSLSYQPFLMARADARRRGFDEALLCWGNQVVEGSTANVFAVREGELITPDLESGCLPGIMRAVILELARSLGLPVREAWISREELLGAVEVFLTSSLAGILPAVRIEAQQVGNGLPGPLARRLGEALTEFSRG